MKKFVLLCTIMLWTSSALAHFGTIIPSDDIVTTDEDRTISLQLKFLHPLEMHYMDMVRPQRFGVMQRGTVTDLLGSLERAEGKSADQEELSTYWTTDYRIKRPGDLTFFVEPQPYWEPAEDLYIIHYAKVCISAFGLEDGWDQPVGLETEIIPLTRPYGLWTNNLFTGQVLLNGKPVPHAEVEVEYLNESPGNTDIVVAPSDPYVTQVVKADADGVFSYAMPRAGWWGFSALNEADRTLPRAGVEKNIEIGAVYWVKTVDMP
ncbi:MAG: DUF4198 domain-containing protein [Desulfuromonas sp.]|nr:MAG: DUF4198 domain-containing protein [Desulfuromonas sp.]